jgi:5-methylcytosine-specific restriction endonuclease McrA
MPKITAFTRKCGRCNQVKPLSEFHKDKNAKCGVRYACKECLSKDARIYRGTEKYKNRIKEWNKRYRETEKYKECQRRFNRTEKRKGYTRNWQAKYRKTERYKEYRRTYDKSRRLELRVNVFLRDDFTCQYCGRKAPNVELQIDHKYPKSKGGLDEIKNYQTLCRECNVGKSDFVLKEFSK